MFKYELHVHSREGSACANSSARELVRSYREAGYSGFVLTDHFIHGNTAVPRNLDWESRMKLYHQAYLEAWEEGQRLEFDVLFGLEHAYGDGKEVLLYGIDLPFLLAHPELGHADIDLVASLVHAAGGLLVHAHPYRERSYITPNVAPRYDVCDGIEVFNACDDGHETALSQADAVSLHKIAISGGDIHWSQDGRIGQAGMLFAHRIQTNRQLVEALKSGEGIPLIYGKGLRAAFQQP